MPRDVSANTVMVENPEIITSEVGVNEAYSLMILRGIGHFPVVLDDYTNEVIGIVSDTDLIPYTPPDDENYPRDAAYIKHRLSLSKQVKHVMTPVDHIHAVIYQDEKSSSFLHKYFRTDQPAFNLLMVINNESDWNLVGVLSWVDILRQWDQFLTNELTKELESTNLVDIAVSLDEVPSLDLNEVDTVQAALRRRGLSVHRHIPIYRDGTLVRLFHYHELMPYLPIKDEDLETNKMRQLNLQLADYFDRLSIMEIPESHEVKKRIISSDMPIWASDGSDNVIKKFLDNTLGHPWKRRLAGLLLQTDSGEITHLLNPYDIISWLAKKKAA